MQVQYDIDRDRIVIAGCGKVIVLTSGHGFAPHAVEVHEGNIPEEYKVGSNAPTAEIPDTYIFRIHRNINRTPAENPLDRPTYIGSKIIRILETIHAENIESFLEAKRIEYGIRGVVPSDDPE